MNPLASNARRWASSLERMVRPLRRPHAFRVLRISLLLFRNKCLILFLKARYRVHLRLKRGALPLHRVHMRRRLLDTERQLIAKHGRDWRLCVFDYEVIHFLKFSKYVHDVLWPNDPSSATRRTGRNDCKPQRHAGFAAAHG